MSVSIIAQLKKKAKNDKVATIYIRGYYNRRPVASISTGKKVLIEHWDPIGRKLLPAAPNAQLINSAITKQVQDMETQLLKKEIMGASVNRNHVSKAVKGIEDSKDFIQFCLDRIGEYKNPETKRTYKSEVTKLQQFQEFISFADIDYSFLTRYRVYIEQEKENEPNTVWKSFKFINTMIRKALKIGGIINHNPFTEFNRGKYLQGNRTYLELSHCDAIEKLCSHESEMIRKVAIYFLLMAYSGMRFADAMLFDPELHVKNNERILMKYQKAQTNVNIKLYGRLRGIVDLIRNNRLQISNKQFNAYMKVIGGTCSIPVNLTAHVGRHTMGGLLAEAQVMEEHAQKILGQKDIRSTRIYFHMKNKTIDGAVDKLNSLN